MQALPANLLGDYELGMRKSQEAQELAEGNNLALAMISGVMGYFELLVSQDPQAAAYNYPEECWLCPGNGLPVGHSDGQYRFGSHFGL